MKTRNRRRHRTNRLSHRLRRPQAEQLEDRSLLTTLVFDTELVSLDLSGGPYPIPLASDPGNALGDSIDGYGFVDSLVTITLSSQRSSAPGPSSLGQACAVDQTDPAGQEGCLRSDLPPVPDDVVDPAALDGQQFFVDSFFDVFFDITVTDVDSRPGRDFAGQPDGASVFLPDNGPANMITVY